MAEIFRTVLNMSITGIYVSAVIIILRLAVKKLPKIYSYMLWLILGVRLLCPFSVSSAVSVFNLFIPEKLDVSSQIMEFIPNDIGYQTEPRITVSVPAVNDIISRQLPSAEPSASANPMMIIMFIGANIWFFGMLAMIICTLIFVARVKKRLRSAVMLRDNIYVCRDIATPFVFGLFRVHIYLPEDIPAEALPYIIAHEQVHIKRRDYIVKYVAMLTLCIHWFNPMVWLSYQLMTKDMESSCDEKALNSFDKNEKKAYANALLNISLKQNGISLGGMLNFGEKSIKERIKVILGAKKPHKAAVVIAVIITSAAAVCLLTNSESKDDKAVQFFSDPTAAAREYLNEKNIHHDDISLITVAENSFFNEAWKYTLPPLSEQYGISENDSLIEVTAEYKSGGSEKKSYLIAAANQDGFHIIDEIGCAMQSFTATISSANGNELFTGYEWQEYVIIPNDNSGDFKAGEEIIVYSKPHYGNDFFTVGDVVTVKYNSLSQYYTQWVSLGIR